MGHFQQSPLLPPWGSLGALAEPSGIGPRVQGPHLLDGLETLKGGP